MAAGLLAFSSRHFTLTTKNGPFFVRFTRSMLPSWASVAGGVCRPRSEAPCTSYSLLYNRIQAYTYLDSKYTWKQVCTTSTRGIRLYAPRVTLDPRARQKNKYLVAHEICVWALPASARVSYRITSKYIVPGIYILLYIYTYVPVGCTWNGWRLIPDTWYLIQPMY